jgi:penicillin-binding protein 1B
MARHTQGRRRFSSPIGLGLLAVVVVLGTARVVGETLETPRLTADLFAPASRVYARPLVLAPGDSPNRYDLEVALRRLGYDAADDRDDPLEPGEYDLGRWIWTLHRRPFRYPGGFEPGGLVRLRLDYRGRIDRIEDGQGRALARLALEPELLGTLPGSDGVDRTPVPLPDLPAHLIEAVLAVEDRRFYEHGGLDLRRIVAAAWANLRAGGVVQGGSTLTQQLVKNLWLTPDRSPWRKLREVAMTLVLERRHTKDEILAAYLNEIYLGQDGGHAIHGVGSAARFYFGKDVTRLDPAESALLAAMIRGPSLYSPLRNPEAARARRDLVLQMMTERGSLSTVELRAARASPLHVQPPEPASTGVRWFLDFVGDRLGGELEEGAADGGGLALFTTLDPDLQRVAEAAVRTGLDALESGTPYLRRPDSPLQAALVALDPRTGALLAMVGGRDYGASQFNRAVAARRQPGSAFKPVVALAALAGGDPDTDRIERPAEGDGGSRGHPDPGPDAPYTLATVLSDEPLSVATPVGDWEPSNYDGRFRGPVTLRDALERSLNVPFARLGLAVGANRIAETGRRLGIEGPLRAVPSIALGTSEVTALELARAYGVLAAAGRRAPLRTVVAAIDADGERVDRSALQPARVFEPPETYLVTSALRGAVERGTGRGLRSLGYYGPVAGKSGTSDDWRDAWFVGYTPSLVVGVWVGYDDGHTVGLPGAKAALPIFARFLIGAVGPDGEGEFEPPAGLEVARIDPKTGLLAGPGCRGRPELFLEGTAPPESCHRDWWTPGRGFSERWRSTVEREAARLLERVQRSRGRP